MQEKFFDGENGRRRRSRCGRLSTRDQNKCGSLTESIRELFFFWMATTQNTRLGILLYDRFWPGTRQLGYLKPVRRKARLFTLDVYQFSFRQKNEQPVPQIETKILAYSLRNQRTNVLYRDAHCFENTRSQFAPITTFMYPWVYCQTLLFSIFSQNQL